MEKTLSQELCEICGVEKKIITKHCEFEEKVYPDFTLPENFVKLFNLKFDPYHIDTLAGEITYKYGCVISVEDFIEKLISFIEATNPNKPTDKIKQAIKEAEWEY